MTTATTEPTATLTLPVWTLQSLRVRALATAALTALDLARREAYWASPAGRARSASMWCGEQDAAGDRLDALRARIDAEQSTADALAAAIIAAGCSPLSHLNPVTDWECVLHQAVAIREFAHVSDHAIREHCDRYADHLRDYLAARH